MSSVIASALCRGTLNLTINLKTSSKGLCFAKVSPNLESLKQQWCPSSIQGRTTLNKILCIDLTVVFVVWHKVFIGTVIILNFLSLITIFRWAWTLFYKLFTSSAVSITYWFIDWDANFSISRNVFRRLWVLQQYQSHHFAWL